MKKERKGNRKRFRWDDIDWGLIGGICGLVIICSFVVFEITLLILYGGKPVDEIPTWVLWFLFTRR